MFDIYAYLLGLGCTVDNKGDYVISNCPIHHGDGLAFVYWKNTQRWKCFSRNCGHPKVRDAKELVSHVLGVPHNDAKVQEVLTKYSTIGVGYSTNNDNYVSNPTNDITDNRVAPKPDLYWCKELEQLGYTKEFCHTARIGGLETTYGKIYAICYEVVNRYGNYVGYTKRLLDSYRESLYKKYPERGLPSKWVHSKGLKSSRILYAENYLNTEIDKVILVESPKDTCFMRRCGIANVVGTFGLGLRLGQQDTLIEMGFTNLVVLTDNDAAGVEYYNSHNYARVCKLFNVRSATNLLPSGADPDELTKEQLENILM